MNKKESKQTFVASNAKSDNSRLAYIERQVATWPDWKKSYATPNSVRCDCARTTVKS